MKDRKDNASGRLGQSDGKVRARAQTRTLSFSLVNIRLRPRKFKIIIIILLPRRPYHLFLTSRAVALLNRLAVVQFKTGKRAVWHHGTAARGISRDHVPRRPYAKGDTTTILSSLAFGRAVSRDSTTHRVCSHFVTDIRLLCKGPMQKTRNVNDLKIGSLRLKLYRHCNHGEYLVA